jgi:uracil phosphoribosyltransferase
VRGGLLSADASDSRHDASLRHADAIDERLNEIGYIVPGLGDAGDRQFGTMRAET